MNVKSIAYENYLELARKYGQTHYLHAKEWSEYRSTGGWNFDFVGIYAGEELVAAANLRWKKIPKINFNYFYIPRGMIVKYDDVESLTEATKALKKYVKKQKGFMVKIDPDIKRHTIDNEKNVIDGEENSKIMVNLETAGWKHQGFHENAEGVQPRYTFRMDLENNTEEMLWKKLEKKNRAAITAAKNKGVELVEAGPENIDDFMVLMKSTGDRGKYRVKDPQFFVEMFNYYPEDKIKFVFARLNPKKFLNNLEEKKAEIKKEIDDSQQKIDNEDLKGKRLKKETNKLNDAKERLENLNKDFELQKEIVEKYPEGVNLAGSIFLYDEEKAWYSHSARLYEYGQIQATNLLLWEIIVDAKNRGYKMFDLFGVTGNIEPGTQSYGLYTFKRSFGGEYTEFIGEYDLPINKPLYELYNFMTKKDNVEQTGIKAKLNSLVTGKK